MNSAADDPTRRSEASALLLALRYPAPSRLAFAAMRLAGAPAVLADLREYLRLGQPAIDATARTPACLMRPLAHELTLATLMSEALLAPSGAFLMAAEMEQDPQRADTLLARLIADGLWTVATDGTRSLRPIPLAGRFPRCLRCGRPQLDSATGCPHCADLLAPPLSPTQGELARLLDWLDALPAAATPTVATQSSAELSCPRCGAGNRPQARYCAECGGALDTLSHCRGCGATVNPGARFCGGCGMAVQLP